ncbi:MAG: methionyl-tRNA formyltransferase [Flavisolibacter sp.]
MGTPPFAVASLSALVEAGCTILSVITSADKPAGRGMKLQQSAVKEYATAHGLKIIQPLKLKDPAFLKELSLLQSDLQVVVAFRMLPEVVWNMPPLGTINVHASLLPQYRGAAPINWAIINGEKITGITTFKLTHAIDTGNILLQKSLPIRESESAGELQDRMKDLGAKVLLKTLQGIAEGSLKEMPQTDVNHLELKQAPKIFSDTGKINWEQSVDPIQNLIRGLSPYPGAYTHFQSKMLKIFKSEKSYAPPNIAPGAWQTDHKSYLRFACANGYILIKELQMEGKKRIAIEEFLKGFRY